MQCSEVWSRLGQTQLRKDESPKLSKPLQLHFKLGKSNSYSTFTDLF